MISLIKYEFIKKYKIAAAFLIIIALINAYLFFRYSGDIFLEHVFVFFSLLAFAFMILYAVDVTLMYSKDLNNKYGYMIFMTPNSGYKILGAKFITAIIEGVVLVVFYVLLVYINLKFTGNMDSIIFNNVVSFENININTSQIIQLIIFILILLLVFILTIYTSITIRKSILSNVKFGGLISFIIFILLNSGIGKISELFIYNNYHHFNTVSSVIEFGPEIIFQIIIGVILFGISGYLLDRKVNL